MNEEMTAGADTLAWEIFRADNGNIPEDELRAGFPAEAEYALNIAKQLRELGYRKISGVIEAVLAIHKSDGHQHMIGPYCTHCISPIDGGPELWPCVTVKAVLPFA